LSAAIKTGAASLASGLKRPKASAAEDHQEPESVPERRGGLQAALPSLEKHREKWTMPIREWKRALQQFAIVFECRMPLP
jgi:hypothetical protein